MRRQISGRVAIFVCVGLVAAAGVATARPAGTAPSSAASPTAAVEGNVEEGRTSFQFYCAQCHRSNSPTGAPLLRGPDSPVVALSDAQIYDLIRGGTNHTPPGPIPAFTLSDQRIADIIAYLRSPGVVTTSPVPTNSEATPRARRPGECIDFDAYQSAMEDLRVRTRGLSGYRILQMFVGINIYLATPEQHREVAAVFAFIIDGMDRIQPPEYARTWHDHTRAQFDLLRRFYDAVATGSVPVSILSDLEGWDAREAEVAADATVAAESCPEFAAFASSW